MVKGEDEEEEGYDSCSYMRLQLHAAATGGSEAAEAVREREAVARLLLLQHCWCRWGRRRQRQNSSSSSLDGEVWMCSVEFGKILHSAAARVILNAQ